MGGIGSSVRGQLRGNEDRVQSGLLGAQALSLDPQGRRSQQLPEQWKRISLQLQNRLLLSRPDQGEAGASRPCLLCWPVPLTPPEEHLSPLQKW